MLPEPDHHAISLLSQPAPPPRGHGTSFTGDDVIVRRGVGATGTGNDSANKERDDDQWAKSDDERRGDQLDGRILGRRGRRS